MSVLPGDQCDFPKDFEILEVFEIGPKITVRLRSFQLNRYSSNRAVAYNSHTRVALSTQLKCCTPVNPVSQWKLLS